MIMSEEGEPAVEATSTEPAVEDKSRDAIYTPYRKLLLPLWRYVDLGSFLTKDLNFTDLEKALNKQLATSNLPQNYQTDKNTEQEKRIQEASKKIIELQAMMKMTLNDMYTTKARLQEIKKKYS